MTPERYQQIDRVFQVVLGLEPERRAAYLDEACSGDEALRIEVESLITSDRGGLSFIDEPAFDMAARVLADDEPQLASGEHIDRYEILSLLGSGGMGEVYLAHDQKLERKIALKLLPSDFTANEERLRRFQQEARAASALNHPNIITIHEIGQVDDRHFIATEFIEGETLRQRMRGGPINLPESLDIAIQICNALVTAHDVGIVHRDIKPENIMLRGDGYAKILDFGLAKLTEQHEPGPQVRAEDNPTISSGLVMGTVRYMSPEQAQGLPVDQRSDLFSLGVVLFEMLTGCAPFAGENGRELVKSILADEPPTLKYLPDAPEALQRIVSKSLSKEKAERYQSAQEMLLDLQTLAEKRISVFAYATAQIAQHKTAGSLALGLVLIVAIAAGFGMYRFFKSRRAHFQNITINKLTNFGDAWNPAISPDGKYVVYAKGWGTEGPGKFSLWRKDVGSASEVQIVPPTEIDGWYGGTNFSPDGQNVIYWVRLKNQPFALYIVPVLGGASNRLSFKYVPSFSPDGKRLAYLDNRLSEGKSVLVVANADGTDERDIVIRQAPNYYKTAIKPVWSPDGKLIACVAQNGTEGFPRVLEINVETRTERPLNIQKWNVIRDIVWLPDMSGLLLAAAEETSSIYQIWHISHPGGDARRITNDTVNYWDVDVSGDGKTLVAQKVEAPTSFLVMPVEARPPGAHGNLPSIFTSNARQINTTTISSGENDGLAWTPLGTIIYVSEEAGNADLWSMNADGRDRKQLTTDPHRDAAPDVSPDGRYVAFVSTRAGAENIWLMDIDGSNQRRLTSKLIERNPVFSADSKWVYFVSWQTGKGAIWKISIEGGEPTQVISDLSFSPAISPDGKLLAYSAPPGKIFIAPSDGGAPIKSFDELGNRYKWMPDGEALTFTCSRCGLPPHSSNWGNVWAQPLDGGAPQQLTDFTVGGVFLYAWSRDGKQLAVASHTLPSDLVLISEMK